MFIVALPGGENTIVVLKQSLEALQYDAIMSRYIDQIEKLRVCESMVISGKYLVVRVG